MLLIPPVWWDMATWQLHHYLLFTGVIRVGFSIGGAGPGAPGAPPRPRPIYLDAAKEKSGANVVGIHGGWIRPLAYYTLYTPTEESPNEVRAVRACALRFDPGFDPQQQHGDEPGVV